MCRKHDIAIDERLLETAVDQFGRHGFDGASTRAIAAAAGTAMSSITYHYGGKEGLYIATAHHIAGKVRERMAGPVSEARARIEARPDADSAIAALLKIIDGFVQVMTSAESAAWSRFIVREQMAPTAAFEILYSEMMRGVAGLGVGLLIAISGGRIDEAEAKVRVLAMFGQVLVFRVARATVINLTGWSEVGPHEAAAVRATVRTHMTAILNDLRGDRP
ncbi:TetR family transcriptional regulator [Sphingomonas sp. DBB INV C78]|uniref:CerR family C-terminal domain-containing protein n=1 Tax=Sphingomonas sp. DBB INV C78 TaxID=3349434 RepID=UPI0036D277B4